MQILAGKYRHVRLVSSPSPKVRPTARRLRESLFGALDARIQGARFLDLCAGSGTIGLEALSRGAAHVTFVERSPRFAGFLQTNLAACQIMAHQAYLAVAEAEIFLRQAARRNKKYDVIYYDPPYQANYLPVLEQIAENPLLRPAGVFVAEHQADKPLPDKPGALICRQQITHGESSLSFFKKD